MSLFDGIIATYGIKLEINPKAPVFDSIVALDVEHDEESGFVGCGFYVASSNSVYYMSDLHALSVVPFSSLAIVAHNGKTDLELLRQWGFDVKNEQLVWDTQLIAHIIDSSQKAYGLKKLAKEHCGIDYPSYDDIVGKKTLKQSKERTTLDKQPTELVAAYCGMDCFATYKLWQKQYNYPQTLNTQIYYEQIEKPVGFILQKAENRGIRVDLEYLKDLKDTLEAQRRPLEEVITNELGNINIKSPKQLLEALNAKEIYPELKNKSSTDKRALEQYRNVPIVSALLQFSELNTLLNSFVQPYLERNVEFVHPYFNQCGTRTGRLSCSNPNLLQIPRRTDNGKLVRRMFIPREGFVLGDADFGQIEPRIMAHLSKDPVLCQMFNDGTDFHAFTAERLGIDRDRAKVLNLSVGYRATSKSVSTQLKCTEQEAQVEINKWWSLFPVLRRWQDSLLWASKRSGYCTTLMGRKIQVEGLDDRNFWKKDAAERRLINNITQGSAAETMKLAMIGIDSAAPKLGLLVQVYDELLFESRDIDADVAIVEACMLAAGKDLLVPLTVDTGTGMSWTEAHS